MGRRRLRPLPSRTNGLQFVTQQSDLPLKGVNLAPLVRNDLIQLGQLTILMGDADLKRLKPIRVLLSVRHQFQSFCTRLGPKAPAARRASIRSGV